MHPHTLPPTTKKSLLSSLAGMPQKATYHPRTRKGSRGTTLVDDPRTSRTTGNAHPRSQAKRANRISRKRKTPGLLRHSQIAHSLRPVTGAPGTPYLPSCSRRPTCRQAFRHSRKTQQISLPACRIRFQTRCSEGNRRTRHLGSPSLWNLSLKMASLARRCLRHRM